MVGATRYDEAAGVQEQAASKPIEWTTEPPTVEGNYIMLAHGSGAKVLWLSMQPLTDEDFRNCPRDTTKGPIYWYGPLPDVRSVMV